MRMRHGCRVAVWGGMLISVLFAAIAWGGDVGRVCDGQTIVERMYEYDSEGRKTIVKDVSVSSDLRRETWRSYDLSGRLKSVLWYENGQLVEKKACDGQHGHDCLSDEVRREQVRHYGQIMYVQFNLYKGQLTGQILNEYLADGNESHPRSGNIFIEDISCFPIEAIKKKVEALSAGSTSIIELYVLDYQILGEDSGPVLGYRGKVYRAESFQKP